MTSFKVQPPGPGPLVTSITERFAPGAPVSMRLHISDKGYMALAGSPGGAGESREPARAIGGNSINALIILAFL